MTKQLRDSYRKRVQFSSSWTPGRGKKGLRGSRYIYSAYPSFLSWPDDLATKKKTRSPLLEILRARKGPPYDVTRALRAPGESGAGRMSSPHIASDKHPAKLERSPLTG